MMVLMRRPSVETICRFLRSQSKLGFTYAAVGATAGLPPAGYLVNHTRIKLGQGEEIFTKARGCSGAMATVSPRLARSIVIQHADRDGRGRGDHCQDSRRLVAQRLPDRLCCR